MKPLFHAPSSEDEHVTVCVRITLDAYAKLLLESQRQGVSSGETLSRLLDSHDKRIKH